MLIEITILSFIGKINTHTYTIQPPYVEEEG